ncbi:heme exporter protein CcmD [Roseibium sp.]|uniref:heme exporter protein CcmD n=1 Tax=Roseibium sp. TaxID=1936156 RepID=UPI003A96D885
MDLGTHAGFIVASYAVCLVVVIGLILWVVIDRKRQEADLEELADQGITRSAAAEENSRPAGHKASKAAKA